MQRDCVWPHARAFTKAPPWPPSDQPWYANAVVRLETRLDPVALLARLHAVERAFGRVRSVPNAPRALDLDLIDHDGSLRGEGAPLLPHPRMATRAFVLLPLSELAPTGDIPSKEHRSPR